MTASGGGSFFVDVRNTTATQVLVAILNVASLAIVSRRFGDVGLGLYALERRGAALIQPLVLLGVTVATPRFVAISIGRRSGADGSYAVTGLLVVGGMAAAAAALIVAWPAPVAAAVFGDPRSVGLARALGGLVLAVAAYQVVYAVFRGYLCMGRANLLELATVGLIPVCLAAVGPTDFLAFMWTLDGALLAVTLLSLATSGAPWRQASPASRLWDAGRARELLRYGIPRTPGDFAVIAPFALAPVAVVHFADAAQAGYTSVVISTLSLVSVVAGPLGVLVLPHVAQEIGGLGRAARRSGLWTRLAEATLDVALGLAAVVILASPAVVSIWLPDLPPHVVTAQRVVAVGIPGYVFYVVFRSYLDAVDVRPLSSIATVTGLACLAAALPALLVAHVLPTAVAASTAVSISVTAMGAVTWWLVRPRLPERLAAGTVVAPAVAALVIASAGVALHGAGTGALVLAGGLAAVAYSALLLALRRSWLMELVVGLRARGGVAS